MKIDLANLNLVLIRKMHESNHKETLDETSYGRNFLKEHIYKMIKLQNLMTKCYGVLKI